MSHPDPALINKTENLLKKYGKEIFLICLQEGIMHSEIIDYLNRLCARERLTELLAEPCPMALISEIEDLAQFKKCCPNHQQQMDFEKYGQSEWELTNFGEWSKGLQ
tara:strand:+ start:341 stop:661 length:321 start_codon:yes stop_codon:yes gene_type:complete